VTWRAITLTYLSRFLIIFGRNAAERVCYQTVISFSTTPTNASALGLPEKKQLQGLALGILRSQKMRNINKYQLSVTNQRDGNRVVDRA